MAESNVTIHVNAETGKAEQAVDRLSDGLDKAKQKAAERTKEAANAATGGGGSGGGTGTPPVDTKQAARDMADEFGKRAGRALGTFLVSYMTNQGVTTAFALMRKPGEDSRRIDQAESTVQGAIQWGGAAATVAGPLGAVVGGLLGGINNFILKEKEIRDSLAKSRIDYDRERGAAKIQSARDQREAFFNWSLGMLTPEGKVEELQKRAKELQGAGEGKNEAFSRYQNLFEEADRARREANALNVGKMRNPLMEAINNSTANRLEKEATALKTDYEKAMRGVLSGNMKDLPTLGGNEVGTANWYGALWEWAKNDRRYGLEDERTGKVKSQLDAINSLIDPLKKQEQDVYLSQLDTLLGTASRSAITDSASTKGLGVGAQIGGMVNDRMYSVVQEILKVARSGQKDIVDAIRAEGGVSGIMTRIL